ncbi:GNAT family N-acetyltransferase [candidate division KSB1 bacterium]|nr:GNAT family N-acetyltransferase [candidate division KSB1 bacterium]
MTIETKIPGITLRQATKNDVPLILQFIRGLADYVNKSKQVVTNEQMLHETLFGDRQYAEVIIADYKHKPAGFAIFFHNYSTFQGQPGIYLEDLFVTPEFRGKWIGKTLLTYLAKLAVERNCGRFEWLTLDWNTDALEFYRSMGAIPLTGSTIQRLTSDALERLAEQF